MRWKPFRITNPWLKLATVVLIVVVRLAMFGAIPSDFAPLAMSVFFAASGLVLLYAVTRVFRVREEPHVPPRAWWRATGRPAAGLIIGGVLAASSVAFVVTRVGRAALEDVLLSVAIDAVVVTFYLNSSVRMLRLPADTTLLPTRRSDF